MPSIIIGTLGIKILKKAKLFYPLISDYLKCKKRKGNMVITVY